MSPRNLAKARICETLVGLLNDGSNLGFVELARVFACKLTHTMFNDLVFFGWLIQAHDSSLNNVIRLMSC
jgi:hypothetical protein